jgi:branched-chain amino acid transport system permease protein
MRYLATIVALVAINAMAATGLNLLVSYCGMNLAAGAYVAVGAYAYAVTATAFGWPAPASAALAVALAVALSPAVSVPAWRLRGDAFLLATLCVAAFAHAVAYNWHSDGAPLGTLANLTNGPYAIQNVPPPEVFGLSLADPRPAALVVLALASGLVGLVAVALGSPWGRALAAMRDDELLARGLGKDTRRLKLEVGAIACAAAGLAGACYAATIRYVGPDVAAVDAAVTLLVIVLVGGTGNWAGPVAGAALLAALPQALSFWNLPGEKAAAVKMLAYGLLLLAVVHLRPRGLAGRYRIE